MVYTIISIADDILFLLMGISILYLFIFAFASLFKRTIKYPKARKKHRYAVLFPAYKEDKVILSAISSFMEQDYPADCYEIIVISDQMEEQTNNALIQMGTTVIKANYKDSSKAKALHLAMNTLDETKYDAVVIMDGDNLVEPNFLEEVNKAYDADIIAIQTHRKAKNCNTPTATLDAVSEEINNSIFRKGHVKLGFSSALIGSGMIFEYKWFKKNIFKVSTAGEDKELEALLLKQNIYIEYLEHINVYDEKVPKDAAFYNQRRRWLASQYGILGRTIKDLPGAIFSGNWDYADKIFQWMMLPRVILLGLTGVLTITVTLYDWILSIKWWILLFILALSLCMAIPDYLVDKNFTRSIKKVPWLGFLMFLNLFRLRGVNKKFIHTEHE